jgi:cell division protein FtsI (penicillin-binding protein 3)
MARASKKERKEKREIPTYHGRRHFLFGLMLAGFSLLIWRSFERQIMETEFLQDQGEARFLREKAIPAHRGVITDRQGEILAVSAPMPSVVATPKNMPADRESVGRLAKALKIKPDTLRRRLAQNRHYVYLKRQVTPTLAARIEALNIDGVRLENEYRRFYPSGEVTAHVVGMTDIDEAGREGMELAYDGWLSPVAGSKRVIKDGRGRVIKDVESIKMPEPGKHLALSLDLRLQFLAYRELKAAVEWHKACSGSAVILDVQTGEVLAMVNRPSYNPNASRRQVLARDRRLACVPKSSRKVDFSKLRNRAVIDVFEPGSTIKPFIVAAAIEQGLLRANETIDVTGARLSVGRHLVRDSHDYGLIDVSTVISKSSNVGASKIALRMEGEQIWDFLTQLGFGARTETLFPGEAAGQLPHFSTWSKFEQATIAYGYGLSVTTLQLAQAYSIFATDGVRYPASLLRLDEQPDPIRIIQPKTAKSVRGMLEQVVTDGTAPKAAVAGYRVAGKTGTAKKSVAGGYADDRYTAAFVGMIPASAPRLVMAVMIDEPTAGEFYGGQVAAPVFSKVMTGAMRLLNVAPDKSSATSTRMAASGGRL